MNALRLADLALATLGDFDAVVAGGRVWTSGAAHDRAARLARGLAALGVAPGDRVLLWLPNGPDLMMAWRAVLRAGAVTVVAHHDSPWRRIEEIVAETAPAALVTSRALLGSRQPSGVRLVVEAGAWVPLGPESRSREWRGLDRIVAEYEPLHDPVPRQDGDIASIAYTSGTTGTPRGVIVRHEALASKIRRLARDAAPDRAALRHLAVLPMSSGFGSGPLSDGLARRCSVHVLDPGGFDPRAVLEAIQACRIERTALVPAMCEALLAVPGAARYDLSSLREVVVGAAHVSPDLIERFSGAFGILPDVQYGLSGIGFVSRTTARSSRGSVGRLSARLEARMVDPAGRDVPAGEAGELMLRRRDGAMVEYWGRDREGGDAAGSTGWFSTGDLARLDAGGELHVLGRVDDLVIQGGANIHGAAVAALVRTLPGVRDCAVVGIPSDYLGQEAVACVVLDDEARLTARDILAHCRVRLDARATLATVWFTGALPRNEAGKVKVHELRAAILAARGAVRATDLVSQLASDAPPARHARLRTALLRLLGTVLHETEPPPDTPDAAFQDMGLDSLGAVEFATAVGAAIGRPVPGTLVYSHPTIDGSCIFLLELLGFPPGDPGLRTYSDETPVASAETIRLDDVLVPSEIDVAVPPTAPAAFERGPRAVLLTGATGFLGRFLVPEILRRLPAGGVLHCLVRAPDDLSAAGRLRAVYGASPSLQALFDQQTALGRLNVVAGDFARPRLGLTGETYARLADDVDGIIHSGAVVDHVRGYRELFTPNVLGTVEIVRLAMARRPKAIDYVSTSAVLRPTRAPGYAATKWASERLLEELHDRVGIAVRVYRPGWIMAHGDLPGQINVQDSLTRLLIGIVVTSLAPESFYVQGRPAPGTHFDGLPVDAVARAIAALSLTDRIDGGGHVVYRVGGPGGDVSLDRIVDWVESAGYRVERMADYAAWQEAFRNRLAALGRSERRRSLLPLIHAWEQPRNPEAVAGDREDWSRFRSHLARLRLTDVSDDLANLPAIDERLIHKCLEDIRLLGLIDSPRFATVG